MKFCPVCGNREYDYAVLGTTAQLYECKECGYRGPIIVEDGELAKKLREEHAKRYKEKKVMWSYVRH